MKARLSTRCPDIGVAGMPLEMAAGCPILAFFARACPELVEGVGSDAAGSVSFAPCLVAARQPRFTSS
jgi:hypothetical protein